MKAKRRLLFVVSTVALVLVALVMLIPNRHEQLYKVTVLPSLGLRQTLPTAINDRGQVVGLADVTGKPRLVLWDWDNGMKDLGPMDVDNFDINNAGQIAGTMTDANGNKQAFFWGPNDGIQLLGTLDGTESFARALNNKGQVVGFSEYIKDQQAFIWDKTGGMRKLTPDEKQYTKATAINDAGLVLGEILTGIDTDQWSPCYWDSTDPATTPTVADISPQDNPLRVEGINNNGHVLARTRRRREGMHWFCLWHRDAELKWLFPVENPWGPVVFNDANQVLYSERHVSPLQRLSKTFFPSYTVHCLRDPKRGKVVLNEQIPRKLGKLMYVTDINSRGCIVGWIRLQGSDQITGVLLEPIPERWGK